MAEARYRGEVVKLDRGYPLVRLEDGRASALRARDGPGEGGAPTGRYRGRRGSGGAPGAR